LVQIFNGPRPGPGYLDVDWIAHAMFPFPEVGL
jgi:hypothetical protein